ncbi:transcriptional repressor [Limibacter armeniacum]|uniref:Fur family transcriptional regulator n=1 Tax=Limibacter armeniacum TaxID=466084 RepID=UPI002FE68A55
MERFNIEESLKEHGIRRTPFRIELLTLFAEAKHALSHHDITEKLKPGQDRVTIYRALDAFVEKGLIHKVPDVHGAIAKYALCSHDCSSEKHEDDHIHFVCHKCEQTYCMEDIHIPKISLPKGYQKDHSDFIIHGTCESCSNS